MQNLIKTAIVSFGILILPHYANAQAVHQSDSSFIDRKWAETLKQSKLPTTFLLTAYATFKKPITDDDCGCEVDKNGRILNPTECEPVNKSGNETKAQAVAVNLIDPATWAKGMMCYREGAPQCKDSDGAEYIGETCCNMVDPFYQRIKSDLQTHILVTEPVADIISLKKFRKVENMHRLNASCRILVDENTASWYLDNKSDGFIARMWLYVAKHYSATTPYALGTLRDVANDNPVTQEELQRSRALGVIQGGRNQDITESQN
jgi:endonuclease I